jgi:hypothetical protein
VRKHNRADQSEAGWPFYRINFNKEQMRWLIENLGSLKEGIYPTEPGASSGYSIEQPPGKGSRRYKEPASNRVLELAAEVECRLELVLDYISGWPRPTKPVYKRRYKSETK